MLFNYINLERLIHSIKTAIACILGFLLTKIIGFPADQWIIITIIVVMCAQIFVGSVVQKAYSRLLGTTVGCLFAVITLITVGNSNTATGVTIALSSFIFSYIATGDESLSYAGTLGAATTAIILLTQKPTPLVAAERFIEICIGLFIASIVSQFVLPIHARTHLRRSQAKTLEQLRDYYMLVMTDSANTEILNITELDEQIVKALIKQRQLAKESARERATFDVNHFMRSLYCEREILRSITYMHNALTYIKQAGGPFLTLSSLQRFNSTVIAALNAIVTSIHSDKAALDSVQLPSLRELKEELEKNVKTPTREELLYINGFLFSAEILTNSLAKLIELQETPLKNA